MDDTRRPERVSRLALGTLLTLAMAVSTFPQFAFGALGPVLTAELELSRSRFGALPTAFFLSAAVASPFVGRLVDAVGGKRGLTGLFTLSAISFAAIGSSPGWSALLVAAGVGGLAMAASNPVTNQLLLAHAQVGRRGTLVGVKQSGVWIGGAFAGAFLPPFATAVGWRAAFGVGAAFALVVAAVGRAGLPVDDVRGGRSGTSSKRAPLPSAVRWLVPYAALMGAGGAAITTYVALFAHEQLGMTEHVAGATLGVLGVAAVVARIGWARVAERATSFEAPFATLAWGALAMTVLLMSAERLGALVLYAAVLGLGATAVAWNAAGMMVVVKSSDVSTAGRSSGVVLTGFYVGLVAAPVAFGAVVDETESYRLAWIGTAALFAAAALLTEVWRRWRRVEPAHTTIGEGESDLCA